jgi:hypothetical protein
MIHQSRKMRTGTFLYFFVTVMLLISCGRREVKMESITAATIAMLDSTKHTTMEWKDSVLQFGTVREGDTVRMEFGFTNTGKQLLFITEVNPSCGCTIADYPKEPIPAGGKAAIKALFATEWHPGAHRKMIMVRANTNPKTSHKLIFTGDVIPKPNHKKS